MLNMDIPSEPAFGNVSGAIINKLINKIVNVRLTKLSLCASKN